MSNALSLPGASRPNTPTSAHNAGHHAHEATAAQSACGGLDADTLTQAGSSDARGAPPSYAVSEAAALQAPAPTASRYGPSERHVRVSVQQLYEAADAQTAPVRELTASRGGGVPGRVTVLAAVVGTYSAFVLALKVIDDTELLSPGFTGSPILAPACLMAAQTFALGSGFASAALAHCVYNRFRAGQTAVA